MLRFVAVVGTLSGVFLGLFAYAPNLPAAILFNVLSSSVLGVIGPGITSVLSLAIPPRARGLGFSIGALYIIPGFPILVVIGGFADSLGIQKALLVLLPVFLLGAYIISSAGAFVEADIKKVRTSAVAQAEVLASRRAGTAKLLLVKDLDVGYDTVQVLFNVNFEVDEGDIIALLGTNGAGKSTLLKAISGLLARQRRRGDLRRRRHDLRARRRRSPPAASSRCPAARACSRRSASRRTSGSPAGSTARSRRTSRRRPSRSSSTSRSCASAGTSPPATSPVASSRCSRSARRSSPSPAC